MCDYTINNKYCNNEIYKEGSCKIHYNTFEFKRNRSGKYKTVVFCKCMYLSNLDNEIVGYIEVQPLNDQKFELLKNSYFKIHNMYLERLNKEEDIARVSNSVEKNKLEDYTIEDMSEQDTMAIYVRDFFNQAILE